VRRESRAALREGRKAGAGGADAGDGEVLFFRFVRESDVVAIRR
jgi:hypothetical protein